MAFYRIFISNISLGEGFNVNIPWNKDLMGNGEYKVAFDRIILPVANQFQPDLILIACGFDAVAADPIGKFLVRIDISSHNLQCSFSTLTWGGGVRLSYSSCNFY